MTGDHGAQGNIGNAQRLELLAQPLSLGVVGIDADIDTASVIKAERSMKSALAAGANRQGVAELLFESGFDKAEVLGFEDAATAEFFDKRRGLDIGLGAGEELFFDAGHAEKLGEGAGAVFG